MNTQLVVRLPVEEKLWLVQEAQKQGVKVSDMARKAISMLQGRTYQINQSRSMLKIMDNLHQKYQPQVGPSDLSTNYKHYLYGQDHEV